MDEISYSRDATVTAVRGYYQFLTKMYLPESEVMEPPADGWPNLKANLESMGKTTEVLALLSHLPYIRGILDDRSAGGPWLYFANWHELGQRASMGRTSGDALREGSEKMHDYSVPPHMVSLTHGPEQTAVLLLDTKRGVVYWRECPDEIKQNAAPEEVQEDPYDYAEDDDEAEWIADSGVWAITDFFEMLKDQFQELHFVPAGERKVIDVYGSWGSDEVGPFLQGIYREHGWPDLAQYGKAECLEAVRTGVKENFPDWSG